jgi:hypothetical protein
MFGRNRTEDYPTVGRREVAVARGGVSIGAILTGVVVAVGSFFLLSALVGGILVALDVNLNPTAGNTVKLGIGAVIALLIAQFLSYLWGGYTAGRMGRGAGFLNGLLVPIFAIVIAIIVGALVAWLGASANVNLPFRPVQLPVRNAQLVDWGTALGIGLLVVMLLGGILGGALGARWHTKLERRAIEDEEIRTQQSRSDVDLTDSAEPRMTPPPRPTETTRTDT